MPELIADQRWTLDALPQLTVTGPVVLSGTTSFTGSPSLSGNTVTVGAAAQVTHVGVAGTAPAAANGAQTTGSAMVAGSTDEAGAVTFTTTGTAAAGVQATITFARTYAVAPIVVLTWGGATTTTGTVLQSTTTATTFTVTTQTALANSTAYQANYIVRGIGAFS